MSILDDELIEDLNDNKLVEDFVKNFKIDYNKHIKPGVDCLGNKVNKGDILMYIHANNDTEARKQIAYLRNSYKLADRPVGKVKEILDIVE